MKSLLYRNNKFEIGGKEVEELQSISVNDKKYKVSFDDNKNSYIIEEEVFGIGFDFNLLEIVNRVPIFAVKFKLKK